MVVLALVLAPAAALVSLVGLLWAIDAAVPSPPRLALRPRPGLR